MIKGINIMVTGLNAAPILLLNGRSGVLKEVDFAPLEILERERFPLPRKDRLLLRCSMCGYEAWADIINNYINIFSMPSSLGEARVYGFTETETGIACARCLPPTGELAFLDLCPNLA